MTLPKHLVAVETAVFDLSNPEPEVLLIQRGHDPYKGYWAIPGGMLEEEETLEEGAVRELFEETNALIMPGELRLATACNRRDRVEQVVIVAFSAVTNKSGQRIMAGDDAVDVAWVPVSELPRLAANHSEIILKSLGEIYHDTQ